MVRTMEQSNFKVCNRESCQATIVQTFLETFFNCRDKFSWNHTTYDFVYKLKTNVSFICRAKFKHDIGKFTTTTSLFLINLSMFNFLRESLSVSYLRSTLIDLNTKLAFHTIDDDL